MSAAMKQQMNLAANMTAEDQTAAISGGDNDEVTLMHDASRQYLDQNININETSSHADKVARRHQQSQFLAHNMSLSNVSASHAHFTDVPDAQEVDQPLSLYSDGKAFMTSGRNH